MNPYTAVMTSPVGSLGICTCKQKLTAIDILGEDVPAVTASDSLAHTVVRQLNAYFQDGSCRFDVPMDMHGTAFQKRVWQALTEIPAGRVMTYGELSARLDTAARAIGGACRNNPIAIVVPCHRIVAQGGVGGFMGQWNGQHVNAKCWLLQHEGLAF